MTQLKPFQKGILINGTTVWAVIDGMGNYKYRGFELLEQAGITDLKLRRDQWYPQTDLFKVFQWIEEELGREVVFRIGAKIPKNAIFPDIGENTDLSALKNVDIAYHMNHKNREGKVLYDPSLPKGERMLEGIGHYRYEGINLLDSVKVICEDPYPCDFDMGLLYSFTRQIFPKCEIEHVSKTKCRRDSDSRECTYVIKTNDLR